LRSLRDQCRAADVAYHLKQWGEWIGGINFGRDEGEYNETPVGTFTADKYETHYWEDPSHEEIVSVRVGTDKAGRLLDGVLYDEFPR